MSALKSVREFVPLPGQEYATPVPPLHKLSIDLYDMNKTLFSDEEFEAISKPSVLISGGGIGGLTLALLLHKASIPFLVLERAKEIKPLGAAIVIGAPVSPLFKQLGIYDEFVQRGKYYNMFHMHNEDLEPVHIMDTRVGYGEYVISRPELYDLLYNSIPQERVLLGKKVLSLTQNEFSVMAECSDNSSYHGDILVGADGAYSAVRQNLYKELKLKGKLPSSDDVSLPFSCVCLVGQTVPLDPEEFPQIKEELSQSHGVLGVSTKCSWVTLTTKQNTVCWAVIHFLDKHSAKRNESFRNSEWGPEAAEALVREVRVCKVPGGKDGKVLTLGEYIDKTPEHLISKVMLEEIVFYTWYRGRTVLLGDACHKMSPAGGSGAITAIHDAVTLANWLSTLRFADNKKIEEVFKEYRAERYPVAKVAFETTVSSTSAQNMLSVLIRGMMKRLPAWLWRRLCLKMIGGRHQASFLPLVEDNAPVKPVYQHSLHKTLAIHKEMAKKPGDVFSERCAPVTI
ncbi:hypothetical protein BGZ52_005431 [Haplosporangium bisporale]|nr:hypothetical protein BGZ52_005431 [Haplosporangium bisporale]